MLEYSFRGMPSTCQYHITQGLHSASVQDIFPCDFGQSGLYGNLPEQTGRRAKMVDTIDISGNCLQLLHACAWFSKSLLCQHIQKLSA